MNTKKLRILNLFGGIGGNRKFWNKTNLNLNLNLNLELEITTVESDRKIAETYKKLYPTDKIIVTDAYVFLQDNFDKYDFIWASPPCQSHSTMVKFTRHKKRKYPDLRLYEVILFLQNFFKGKFVVENVKPFYTPLIQPSYRVGRHLFWANFIFNTNVKDVQRPRNFINKTNMEGMHQLQDWLGIYYKHNLYYNGNHCPAQVLRNCVHPFIGKHILQSAFL